MWARAAAAAFWLIGVAAYGSKVDASSIYWAGTEGQKVVRVFAVKPANDENQKSVMWWRRWRCSVPYTRAQEPLVGVISIKGGIDKLLWPPDSFGILPIIIREHDVSSGMELIPFWQRMPGVSEKVSKLLILRFNYGSFVAKSFTNIFERVLVLVPFGNLDRRTVLHRCSPIVETVQRNFSVWRLIKHGGPEYSVKSDVDRGAMSDIAEMKCNAQMRPILVPRHLSDWLGNGHGHPRPLFSLHFIKSMLGYSASFLVSDTGMLERKEKYDSLCQGKESCKKNADNYKTFAGAFLSLIGTFLIFCSLKLIAYAVNRFDKLHVILVLAAFPVFCVGSAGVILGVALAFFRASLFGFK